MPKAITSIRAGIIGTGFIGPAHIEALKRIGVQVSAIVDNDRAIALYQRFGFRHEGVHRGFALRDGAYVDVISMARLHPAPPRIESSVP